MANKTLNTRIKLRYDSYENWLSKNPVLLAGEVAFATIEENKDGVQNAPSVLIKVGDGTSEYKSLKFVSALAADVLAACKSEEGLTAFVNGVIAEAGIATDEAMQALAGRVTTAEGKISTAEGKISTIEGQISTLNGEGAGSVAKAIADAIAALDLANTYEAKGEAAKVESALNSYKEANDIALAGVKATAEAAYVKPVAGISKDDLDAGVQLSLGKADTALQSHQDISHLAVESSVASRLAGKVDSSDYTTKVGEIEAAIATKVDSETYTTKVGAIETTLGTKADESSVASRLAGKVDNTTYEAKVGEINTALGTKAVKTEVNAALELKADKTALESAVSTINGELALKAVASEVEGEIERVEGLISDNADAIAVIAGDYVKAADIADFETKENVKKVADDLAAYVESNDAAIADRYTKGEADAKFAVKGEDVYDDSAIVARVAAIEADYLVEADIANFETKANVKVVSDKLDGYISSNDTALAGVKATADAAAVKTEVEAALALKADKTALEATDKTLTEVKEVVDNFFSESAVADDVIDTLKDIAAYIATDKEGAADITARVGSLEGKVDVEKVSEAISAAVKVETDRATGVEGGLAERIGALEAVKDDYKAYADQAEADAKSYADGLNTAMDARVAELEAVDFDAYVAADEKVLKDAKDYVDGKDSAMNTRVLALEGINHNAYIAADAALKAELQAEIDSDVKVVADALAQAKTDISAEIDSDVKVVNDALEAYKTANNTEVAKKANQTQVDAIVERIGVAGDILIFDCGNADA